MRCFTISIWDYLVFGFYMLCVLGVGFYYFSKNESTEDYYVGGRKMSPGHVGLSIVATDVGGGFSIGLGGLGFLMGLSGSWLLFTGLVGAWLTAVFILPRIKAVDKVHKMMTYPDFLRFRYNDRVAIVAAVISGIGYMGFTGAQVLAGATLASSTIITEPIFSMEPMTFALLFIGIIIIGYTVLGGIKAVIYTDMVQWLVLLAGLIFVAIPLALRETGGLAGLKLVLPAEFFSLSNVSIVQIINWFVTIIPIWFIGMTLYQRMFAVKDLKDAKKAWYIAGIFEYPIMAFMGVILGMCARALFPEATPETGIPLVIRNILPVGLKGVVIAAYFSAIMSTADSCLMASSGNFLNDILERYFFVEITPKQSIRLSQIITLIIGIAAILLASHFSMVLEAILYAYSFIVSGLFIPTLGAYFWKKSSSTGAFWGMLSGGTLTLVIMITGIALPLGLDATVFGLGLSFVTFVSLSLLFPDEAKGGAGFEIYDALGEDELDDELGEEEVKSVA